MSGYRVLRRVLVANRGEIAVRVIRTCRRLGIETVLTVSDADTGALPARLADRVIRIGPAPATASYLSVDAVVRAAAAAGADAVHPGYGFLSENARLARACAAAGIAFIGPAPETLEATGDKLAAREHAIAAGLPVLPGGHVTPGEAGDTARRIGFPVLVKAAGGGGGRGLRVVRDAAELEHAVAVASAEAEAAFADPRVYLERYVERGRHVEVQLLGDGQHVIHLGDRDCSVQRRYQKLIEEAPAPDLADALREALRTAAVALGEHLAYQGAGTVEFLVDAARGEFYFLEVNARIQVEHPVTEAVTGIDIVAEQIAIAEGRPLRLKQGDVTFSGHAIEVRLNAEDPALDFRPSPGTVARAAFPVGANHEISGDVEARSARHLPTEPGPTAVADPAAAPDPAAVPAPAAVPGPTVPGPAAAPETAHEASPEASSQASPGAKAAPVPGAGAVRVDTHLQAGATVPPYYDSLLAKVIGHGSGRGHALAVLRDALGRCAVDGVTTNLDLHRALLADPEFAAGGVDTGYLGRWLASAAAHGGSHGGPRAADGAHQEPRDPAPGDQPAGNAEHEPVQDDHD